MLRITCIAISLLVVLLSVPDLHAFAPGLFGTKRSFSLATTKCTAAASSSPSSARPVVAWYASETLESLLPREDAVAILSEILDNDSLIMDNEDVVKDNWEKLVQRLSNETRTTGEILGSEATDRVLQSVRGWNEYDPQAVRAFLGSDAVNALFAKILYDGIFEFVQKMDVFGNIANNLPILGPIRRQIVIETKKSLDRTLGPLVQQFLGAYTKVAVLEAVEFVVSPGNRMAFGTANVKLVSSLLDRPVQSLIPPAETTDRLRQNVLDYFKKANNNREEVEQYVHYVYDVVGDKQVDSVINVDRVLDASPTLQKAVDSLWTRALHAAAAAESKDEP